ncbi:MAG: alpha-2-macroglobulin family protein [bacterium]
MKRLKFKPFLILLCISIFLSIDALRAAPFNDISIVSTNSIDSLFTGWDNWTVSSSPARTSQVKAPASAFNLEINKNIWPAASTSSISSVWDWPATAPSWSTSLLSVQVSKPGLEISRSIWPITSTSSLSSLWEWPDIPPAWSTILRDVIPTKKPPDFDTIYGTTSTSVEYDFDQLWQNIDEAIGKGLPKTAIEYLKELIPITIEHERYGIAMKAICKQLVLEATIQGNKPEEKITRLTEEIEKAPELLKPLLKLVLAEWYWQYYQNNRWRFFERDTTAAIEDKDFTTWDLPKLFNKIDELYTEVLSEEALLKSTPIIKFTDFFKLGNVPLSYRPTLFDFAAFSAISFYQDGDQMRTSPEDAFELSADSDAFAQAEVFIQYSPETTDTSSPLLKAIKLYQRLLNFHINDTSKEAFVDTDINRLIFVKAYSFGEEISERYMTRLSEIAEAYPSLPLSSLAYYYWAQELYIQGDYSEAHKIAQMGVSSEHADSNGGKMCQSLLATIEAKEMNLESEYSMTPVLSEVRISYRNITRVYLRIVEDQWDDFLDERYGSPEYMSDSKIRQLLGKPAIKSWSVILEPTIDYKTHSQAIELPPLQPGYYRLIASWREDFTEKENAISIVPFWMTEIAMVTKTINAVTEGFIVHAHNGKPLKGAQVKVLYRDRDGYYKEGAVLYTDENGSFTIPDDYQYNVILYAQYKEYALLSQSSYYGRISLEVSETDQTVFFTDRSIYRPGQTIHFKVLAIKSNQAKDTYDFLPNTKLTVLLRDYNYQEVEHLDLITNAFGSASGTFTAPSGKLTGEMTISCEKPKGSARIRVEEYKRPKFRVILDPLEKESLLDEEVELTGLALAYTGAPIDDGKVSYRVVREIRYPIWRWWGWYPPSNTREIAHGRLTTDAEGKFRIRFTAKPDRSIPESDDPTFIFRVSVDVTDSAGETRSGSKSISIGYVSMALGISTTDWLTADAPIQCSLSAMTLDGQPLNTSGKITVITLKQPQNPVRAPLLGTYYREEDEDETDESNWQTWSEDETVVSSEFTTLEGEAQTSFTLSPGVYRVIATAYDRYGKEVKALLPIMVMDPEAPKFNVSIPNYVQVKSTTVKVGDTLKAVWGTGYEEGYAFIEIEHRGEIVKKYWTDGQNTQQLIEWAVGEEYRGGFSLHITHVHDNRAYITTERISVPWTNKDLEVSFSSFRSKLEPGAEETWTIQVKGPDAENVAAELVATLYDSSLDAFSLHNWSGLAHIFRQDYSVLGTNFVNRISYPQNLIDEWNDYGPGYTSWTYTQFPDDVVQNYGRYIKYGGVAYGGFYAYDLGSSSYGMAMITPADTVMMTAGSMAFSARGPDILYGSSSMQGAEYTEENVPAAPMGETYEEHAEEIDLSYVPTRTNLNETAFFFPHLLTDGEGQVSITFTMPEALTAWKFMGFAHAKDLLWGMLTEEIVTQKDIMVQPNPPRFLREEDYIVFSAKVTNISDEEQNGTIRLSLSDTLTGDSLDTEFLNVHTDQPFSVPPKSSRSFYWELEVPDCAGMVTHKVVAASAQSSDGEENVLPVLSRRILVTESLPLPIRGVQIKSFSFDKLLESAHSETLALTLQMVSNPAWYAVQSLPYLMEFPYDCSEQVFNQLYANALAREIANSDPKIHEIFSQWRETDALTSNLEKNEELKSVLLEETPWVRAAEDESQSKQRIGLLFDDDHVEISLSQAYNKLAQMQLSDGSWSWFPGGQSNFYITLYIMAGFGRLRHMNIDIGQDLAQKCIQYVDSSMNDTYNNIKKYELLEQNNLSSTIAMYLYGRSFFLDTYPIPIECEEAVNFYLNQAAEYWLYLNSRLSQGHLALACMRLDEPVTAHNIIASLKERSVNDEEMGMYWRDLEFSWWWYKAPIETQAVMIEAFDEVANDQQAGEDMKVWLLKQKQTQNWKTTKSTADAVYALLLRGINLLASDELVKVTLGEMEIIPETTEAGTGFYEKKFIREEVEPEYGQVTVEKVDEGVAWGSLHWQYLEDMSKVTPYNTPLYLEKSLYVERQSKAGPVIEPVEGDLAVGDLIIVRIVLRVDRDMEYVHMKDYRGSGTEPVNVLSHYKYQDGLYYYESTRDTATHFFIDYLPKGTYVFEYPLRIQHKGEYQMGIATIQCMYAPEFNSHSATEFITVR